MGSIASTSKNNNSSYSRKKKSLGVLAENFLKAYQNLPQGAIIIVDEAAVKLGVERRRIYDVVNILESLCLVCKKHKNTYTWMGMDHLDAVFGRMQVSAMEEYPDDAKELLGATELDKELAEMPVGRKSLIASTSSGSNSKGREFKSLAKLSQEFLHVFLVGHQTLSLPEASDKIQGTTSLEDLAAIAKTSTARGGDHAKKQEQLQLDDKELKAAAARGLKTKIRRLYDIANVFLSLGLLKKVDSSDSTRRPNFSWSYRLSPKELYDLHRPHNKKNDKKTEDILKGTEKKANRAAVVSDSSSASSSPCSSASNSASPSPNTTGGGCV